MSNSGDTSGENSGIIEIAIQDKVGVAYTLNNDQPVKCSYVGAEPLFFMDVDIVEEDEDLEFLLEMEDLDQEIDRLNQKIDAYERFTEEEGITTEGRIARFQEDLIDMTDFNPDSRFAPKIDSLVNLMQKSRFAGEMLRFAREKGVRFEYSTHVMTAEFDRQANNGQGTIFLNPHRKLPDTVLSFAGELRKVWQRSRGAGVHPLAFDPDQAILVNRVQAADVAVAMVRTAWEMYLGDYKSVWDRMERSSLNDVARSFAREAFLDFRTLNNGEAASAAFETWFLSERCRVYDKTLIQSMLADQYGKIFQASGEFASRAVSELITKLGEMPFGKNYLAQYAGLIMQDPIFTDVRDRSNANFLWFIKFEQSFRTTEQELQSLSRSSESGQNAGASAPADKTEYKEERYNNVNAQEAFHRPDKRSENAENVIAFPRPEQIREEGIQPSEEKEKIRSSGQSGGSSGSIVLFPHSPA